MLITSIGVDYEPFVQSMANDLKVMAAEFLACISYKTFAAWRKKAFTLLHAAHNPDFVRWLPLGLQPKTLAMIENVVKILSEVDFIEEVDKDSFRTKCYRRRHRRHRHHHRHPPRDEVDLGLSFDVDLGLGFDHFHKVDTCNMGYTWRFQDLDNVVNNEGSFIPWDGEGKLVAIEGQTSKRGSFPPICLSMIQNANTDFCTMEFENNAGKLTCTNVDYVSQKLTAGGKSTYFWSFRGAAPSFREIDVCLTFIFAE